MTPERKAAFERLVDALIEARDFNENEAPYRAALTAFVERLTAGEEVVRVVNPEYPSDKHYWAANNVPTFPVSYVITPGTFRVTRVEEGE